MCCQNLWKKSIPFTLTLMLGLSAVNALRKENQPVSKPTAYVVQSVQSSGINNRIEREISESANSDLKIVAKPRPNYTDSARQSDIQGTVTLRVTFLANGAIGSISPINGLPDGLTEQAVAAARKIKFEPATSNNIPVTVTKQVQYNFTLY